jgi:hypothetical protein
MPKFNEYTAISNADLSGIDEFGIWDSSASEFKNVTLAEFLIYVEANIGVTVSTTWDDITNKPTTLAGFGITDVYTKVESDNLPVDAGYF